MRKNSKTKPKKKQKVFDDGILVIPLWRIAYLTKDPITGIYKARINEGKAMNTIVINEEQFNELSRLLKEEDDETSD